MSAIHITLHHITTPYSPATKCHNTSGKTHQDSHIKTPECATRPIRTSRLPHPLCGQVETREKRTCPLLEVENAIPEVVIEEAHCRADHAVVPPHVLVPSCSRCVEHETSTWRAHTEAHASIRANTSPQERARQEQDRRARREPLAVPHPWSCAQQYRTHVSSLHIHISCAISHTIQGPGAQMLFPFAGKY